MCITDIWQQTDRDSLETKLLRVLSEKKLKKFLFVGEILVWIFIEPVHRRGKCGLITNWLQG